MRLKVTGSLLHWPKNKEWIPTHDIYSMLLNRLGEEEKENAHKDKKEVCFFTFSKITVDHEKQVFHFYFSSTEEFVTRIKDSFDKHPLFYLEGNKDSGENRYILKALHNTVLKELTVRDQYFFKGRLLASTSDRKRALTDDNEIEDLLISNGKAKLEKLGFDNPDLRIKIVKRERAITRYDRERYDEKDPTKLTKKAIRIPSHYVTIKVEGDYDAIEALYAIGFGQNTGTGNGLLWEV